MGKRKKKEPEAPAGLPAWMATFSDLVTLLLTFFVMLLAMATLDRSREVQILMKSLRQTMPVGGFGAAQVSDVIGESLSDSQRKSEDLQPEITRPRDALEADLSPTITRVSREPSKIKLRLDEANYFEPGAVEIRPEKRGRIIELGREIATYNVDFRLTGHTDESGDEEANWRLSSLRAAHVAWIMQEEAGIDPERIYAAGSAHFEPTAILEEDRARNRRVEITLIGTDSDAATAMYRLQQLGWIDG